MHKALAPAALILAATLSAQIPLPNYTSTFSAQATRGFYFQTPVPIVINGLRVPDETRHGTQNVEVFKLNGPPPAWPATATGGQVFYMTGVPSNQVIPCNLVFLPNEWVGVLGACGNASNMHNSYGTTAPASNVLGNPITLTRFLTQFNIVSSGGNQPYSSENGTISRVQVFVGGQSAAIEYGTGAGIGTTPAPVLTTTAWPIIGKTATLSLTQNHPGNPFGLMVLGRGRASIPALQGTVYVNPALLILLTFPAPLGTGANPLNLAIPNEVGLISPQPLNFQGFVFVLPNAAMSNGMEWLIGY